MGSTHPGAIHSGIRRRCSWKLYGTERYISWMSVSSLFVALWYVKTWTAPLWLGSSQGNLLPQSSAKGFQNLKHRTHGNETVPGLSMLHALRSTPRAEYNKSPSLPCWMKWKTCKFRQYQCRRQLWCTKITEELDAIISSSCSCLHFPEKVIPEWKRTSSPGIQFPLSWASNGLGRP